MNIFFLEKVDRLNPSTFPKKKILTPTKKNLIALSQVYTLIMVLNH